MSRKKGPRLTADDEALWRQVAARTRPLEKGRQPPKKRARIEAPQVQPAPTREPDFTLRPFRVGETAQPRQVEAAAKTPAPAMDRKAYNRLKRGKLKPEGRIDLHGMTLAEAHPQLIRFVHAAHGNGKRLVLVITGKGRTGRDHHGPIPSPPGVLRRQVPDWLSRPPLSAMVLQVTPANIRHGGEGAYYVYLRRPR